MYYSRTSITRTRITRIPLQLELNLTNFLSLDQTFTESYCSIGSQGTQCRIIRGEMSVNTLRKEGVDLHTGQW